MSFKEVGRAVLVVFLVILFLAMGSGAQQPPQIIRVPDPQQGILTIQKAVDMIAEGGTILVAPGIYDENLIIKKSLTLRGEGKEPKEVQIIGAESGRSVIRIESGKEIKVEIENLTAAKAKGETSIITASGKAKVTANQINVTEGEFFGIVVNGGRIVINNSVISRNVITGVMVNNNGEAIIKNSEISWTKPSETRPGTVVIGVNVYHGKAQISDSQIFANGWRGVEIGSCIASATIQGSRIFNHWDAGVNIACGEATIQNSEIFNTNPRLVLGRYYLPDGSGTGIMTNQGKIFVKGNVIRSNKYGISWQAAGTIKQNQIYGNERYGISLFAAKSTSISSNFIYDNGDTGIIVRADSFVDIQDNQVYKNGGYGISAYWLGCVEDYKPESKFVGQVTGGGNTIPGKDEPDGNKKGDVCPSWLDFLKKP